MSHLEQHEAVKSAEAGAAIAAQAGSRMFEDSYGSSLKPGGGGGNSSGSGKGEASLAEAKPAGGSSGGSASSDRCIEIKPLKQSN